MTDNTEKLLKAQKKVEKINLQINQLQTKCMDKNSYFVKIIDKYYYPNLHGSKENFINEGCKSLIETELEFLQDDLKRTQEKIEHLKKMIEKNNKKLSIQEEEDNLLAELPEKLKDFLKEVEKESIKSTMEKEKIKHQETLELQKTQKYVSIFYPRSKEEVEKSVKKSVRYLALDLIKRVHEKVGKITDTSLLWLGYNNLGGTCINGSIIGEKGKCIVESVLASGPIQRLHVRVLVK